MSGELEGTQASSGTPDSGNVDSSDAISQAFDLEPSPQNTDPTPAEGTPAEFDPSQLNVRTGSIDDVPEDLRSYYEPIFKLAHELQAGATKRDQDLQEQIRRNTELEQDWRTRIQELATGQAGGEERIEDTLGEMTPERREGIEIVNKLIGQSLGPVNNQLAKIDQIAAVVGQMQQQSQVTETNRISGEVADARSRYGNQVDEYGPQISALVNVTNPRTGQPYTVSEAFETVSGKAVAQSNALQAQDQAVRDQMKQRIGGPVASPPSAGANPLTDADLRQGMSELGFEP